MKATMTTSLTGISERSVSVRGEDGKGGRTLELESECLEQEEEECLLDRAALTDMMAMLFIPAGKYGEKPPFSSSPFLHWLKKLLFSLCVVYSDFSFCLSASWVSLHSWKKRNLHSMKHPPPPPPISPFFSHV